MKKKLTPQAAALMFAQLAVAARRGLPTAEVLRLLSEDTALRRGEREFLRDFADACSRETRLSAAMAHLGAAAFKPATVRLVAAGEDRDQAAATLATLAGDYQRFAASSLDLRAAVEFPLTLLAVAMVVVAVLMIFVVPAFKDVFSSFGADLPGVTLFILSGSNFVAMTWLPVLVALALLYWLHRTRRLPATITRQIDRAPMRLGAVRRFVLHRELRRLLYWLRAAGEDPVIMEAALHHQEATTWRAVAPDLAQVRERLTRGESPGDALAAVQMLPTTVGVLLRLGERSGEAGEGLGLLDEMFATQEAFLQQRLHTNLLYLTYAVVGPLVGLILIALYLPIFKLGSIV